MNKQKVLTISFLFSCFFGLILCFSGLQEQMVNPFSELYSLYFTFTLFFLGVAIISRRWIE